MEREHHACCGDDNLYGGNKANLKILSRDCLGENKKKRRRIFKPGKQSQLVTLTYWVMVSQHAVRVSLVAHVCCYAALVLTYLLTYLLTYSMVQSPS